MQLFPFALAFLIFSDFLRVFCPSTLPFLCVADVTHAHATEYQSLTPTPPAHAPEGRSTLSNNFFLFFIFFFFIPFLTPTPYKIFLIFPLKYLVIPIIFIISCFYPLLPLLCMFIALLTHLYIIPYLLISFAFKPVLRFLCVFACLVLYLPLFFILSPTTMSHHHVPHPLAGE